MIPAIDPPVTAPDLHGMGDGAVGKGDDQAFVRAPGVRKLLPGLHHKPVDMGIITIRVVMEKDQLLHIAFLRNAHPFQPGAMPPAFLIAGQLFGSVLGVVHHNVGVLGQIAESLIVDRRSGFVVGGEDERPAIRFNSVSHAPLGMVQGSRPQSGSLQADRSAIQVGKVALGRHDSHIHGKVRIGHLTFNGVLQLGARPQHGMEHELVAPLVKRQEERDSLDVVPMKVGEKKRSLDRAGSPNSSCKLFPSPRIPLPQSRMIRVLSARRTSRQQVLPP